MDTQLDKTYFIIGAGNIGQALAARLCDLGVTGSRQSPGKDA
jgi:predicted dinucleotide-binding enzyme